MKKVIKATLMGASVLALASTAFAADINVNIYGASAQNKFWNDYAEVFLTSPAGMGCDTAEKGFSVNSSKRGITVGHNCSENGGDDVYIRYTANKSVEGPRAVMNLDPQENDSCITGAPSADGERLMADWTDTNANGVMEATEIGDSCMDIQVGASDVASEAFTQESHGWENGTYDMTQFDEILNPATIPGVAEIGTAYQPIIVPFSFFANTSLNVDHINRQQAVLLMSGNVYNWNQFGSDYPNKKVVVCMRHAGSGTHATLDKAVMREDRLLPTNQKVNVPPFVRSPSIMFHTSSSNLMDCVDDNGGYATTGAGAIGYADSDKAIDYLTTGGDEIVDDRYINTKRLAYNGGGEGMTAANFADYGYSALKNEIINGSYEFWAAQWIYIDQSQEDQSTIDTVAAMMSFAADSANMVCDPANGLERGCYWSAGSELNVIKDDDSTVPYF